MHTGLMRQLRQAGMEKGRVAIFDASNVTRKFRIELVEELRGVVQVWLPRLQLGSSGDRAAVGLLMLGRGAWAGGSHGPT